MKTSAAREESPLQQRRIMVVDDEPQITRVLRTTLSSHGYVVHTASDGDEALEVMREWLPDLIITDLAMPNLAGLDVPARADQTGRSDYRAFRAGRGKNQDRSPGRRRRRFRHQAVCPE